MRNCLVLGVVLIACASARADRGMFLLDRLPAAKLKSAGVKLSPSALRKLAQAVVQVGRGGSGSFVSRRGLLVTNHHVAYGCLARLNALPEHKGLMERGHYAATPKDELPCPGYDLHVVRDVKDVTAKVQASAPASAPWKERFEAARLAQEDLVQQCERGGQICHVAAMDGGRQYLLTRFLRIRDVRLVYAPAKALGKFGGDIDNWMYPRHSADYTFLRAYVDGKGQGSAHAPTNKPLSTPIYLTSSRAGLKRGDAVMVIGFPGRTSRHGASFGVEYYLRTQVPRTLDVLRGLIAVLHARAKASDESRRKYEGLEASLQNGLKYYEMSAAGMKRWQTLERRRVEEQALLRDRADAKSVWTEIGTVYKRYRTFDERWGAVAGLTGFAPASLAAAYDIVRWSVEKQKTDRERKDARYKDKNVYRFRESAARLEREVDRATEKALLLYLLRRDAKRAPSQKLRSLPRLLARTRATIERARAEAKKSGLDFATHYKKRFGATPSSDPLVTAVDVLYGQTRLFGSAAAAAERARLFDAATAAVHKHDDPLLAFARDLEVEHRELREGAYREVEERLPLELHARWVALKGVDYPDANFTPRLTYGHVADYTSSATKKKHACMTTLSELLAKDRGKYPFEVPAVLRQAFASRLSSPYVDRALKDIPVNFTTTLDITGGNSGSPVVDARGRLVGVIFDGTPESILSDWQYLHEEQRSIGVDARLAYYLATLEKDRGRRLLRELGVVK